MKNKKKKLLLSSILFCVFIIGFIISYAFFNFSAVTNDYISVGGEIVMKLTGLQSEVTVNTNSSYPSTRKQRYNLNNYMDFGLQYNTTSDKDVYYEIYLENGTEQSSKTRIDPKYLKFDLYKYRNDGTGQKDYVFLNQTFDSINHKIIETGKLTHDYEDINVYKIKEDYDEELCFNTLKSLRNIEDTDTLSIYNLQTYCTKEGSYVSTNKVETEWNLSNKGYLQSMLDQGWTFPYVSVDSDGKLLTDDESVATCVAGFSSDESETEVNPIWTTFCKGESDSGIYANFTVTDYLNGTKPYLVSPLEDEINYYLEKGIITGTAGNYVYNVSKAEDFINYYLYKETGFGNDGWYLRGKTLYEFGYNLSIGYYDPWTYSIYYDMKYSGVGYYWTVSINESEEEELYNQGILEVDYTYKSSNSSSVSYQLRMWISDEVTICDSGCTYTQTEWNNLYASVKVSAYGDLEVKADINYDLPLYEILKNEAVMENETSTYVTSSIDLTSPASDTNGNGIYLTSSTTSEIYPVYYVRGITKKVIFADYCWDVIRSTTEGGVKLLYAGTPSEGKCLTSSSIGTSKYNEKANSMAYVGYYYGQNYEQEYLNKNDFSGNLAENHYAKDVEYMDGTYTLVSGAVLSDTTSWSTSYSLPISEEARYTCLTTTDTCEEIYYIMDSNENGFYYLKFKNGDKLQKAIENMTYYSTNETPSTIATMINNWYKNNLISYTSKLEDALYCNYRDNTINDTFKTSAKNTGVSGGFYYGINNSDSTFKCGKIGDALTVGKQIFGTKIVNGNRTTAYTDLVLTYPIGLISYDEANAMGIKSSTNTFWTMTPHSYTFDGKATVKVVSNTSDDFMNSYSDVDSELDVRPVITLKYGVTITKGDGSKNNPYVINN